MKQTPWIQRNEDYVGDIARDDDLSDAKYCDVLEDLIDRAQSMLDAKREECSTTFRHWASRLSRLESNDDQS